MPTKLMTSPRTFGLTHIALAVKDTQRSLKFYQGVFGVKVMYEKPGWIQVKTPGSHDILVFEEGKKSGIGKSGGIAHFGFRLRRAAYIREMVKRIHRAGGKITSQGEFVPGEPYVFFRDPDGYEIEVWYELLPRK